MPTTFLTARWEHLVFLTYDCPPALLEAAVPRGTTLDAWEGRTFVSLVGLRFRDTRVRGFPVPCHRTFEEVNLRFYVRRPGPDGQLRRAVVFLRELVPRRAIAAVARRVYNEPYLAVQMSNATDLEGHDAGLIAYFWYYRGRPYGVQATVAGAPTAPEPGSLAEFITEHYWGYTRQQDGGTLEYRVDHPRWPVWTPGTWSLEGPVEELYGPDFGAVLRAEPASVLAAPGSAVAVMSGVRLSLPPG